MDDYEDLPGTETGRDATAGIRYPISLSHIGPWGLLGGRRIEGAGAMAGAAVLLLTVAFIYSVWWDFALHHFSVAGTILSSIFLMAGLPALAVVGVKLTGVTARDLPLYGFRLASFVTFHARRAAKAVARRTPRPTLRPSAQRAWVQTRRTA